MKIKMLYVLFFLSFEVLAQTIVPISISYLPSGAIMGFETACPLGWSPYTRSAGRFLLGTGSGNADANGQPLKTRNTGEEGGLEYTSGLPASTVESTDSYPPNNNNVSAPIGSRVSRSFVGIPAYVSATLSDTTLSGTKADSNMPPYYTVNYCIKD